jgi:beta-lactamase class D
MRRLVLAVLITTIMAGAAHGQQAAGEPDLSPRFSGLDATFVLLNGTTGMTIRYNPERADVRFPPCSTFKIPNTAILLESGAAPAPDHLVRYDPALKQTGAWARDHTLRSAFKESTMWYYQALARRAGQPAMAGFVTQFGYGNRVTTGGVDTIGKPFWVDGSLRISANEQVQFLRRFYERKLGLSDRTTMLTKEIMLAEQTPSWRLSAKTGACQPAGEATSNWYVGFVEKGTDVHYFALQMVDKDFGRAFAERATKAREVLIALGVLTPSP